MFMFILGLLFGAGGFWAYRTFWKPEDRWEDSWAAPANPIQQPSASEVHGRPQEPIPGSGTSQS
jgi:hypothetical protein